jgi:hypothetical protein
MKLIDFLSTLTTTEARSGQNTKVKANKRSIGKSYLLGSGIPKTLSVGKNTPIGVLDELCTLTEKSGSANVIRRYAKVLLDDAYYDEERKLISYLWFKIEDLDFIESPSSSVKPVLNQKDLAVVYSNTVGGVRLRTSPTLLPNTILRTVPYGDIVGYTDQVTKPYLSLRFLKIYSAKGIALGWVSQNNVTQTKPQAQGLPKETAAGLSPSQDPQAQKASAGLSIKAILRWVLGFLSIIGLSMLAYSAHQRRKEIKHG